MSLLKDFLLEAYPNPERKGCPGEEALKALAEDRLSDPSSIGSHVGSCSECFAEYRSYRLEWEGKSAIPTASTSSPLSLPHFDSATPAPRHTFIRAKTLPVLALAASFLIMVGGLLTYRHVRAVPTGYVASGEPVSAKVDLFEAGTLRGVTDDDPAPLQEVSLPAAIVHLSVTLPRFSQSGRYEVMVSKDRAGREVVAMGAGLATGTAGKVAVDVTLDLRAANPGAYFLATVRSADNGTYYYPLKVK